MTFDWAEYLNLAQELAGRATTPSTREARMRSAVSRAYYAAFCKARNQLRDGGDREIPSTGEAHPYVWNKFQSRSEPLCRKIGQNGNRLRRKRRAADYDDAISNLPSLALTALAESEQIISALRTL